MIGYSGGFEKMSNTDRVISSNERIRDLIQYLGISQVEFCKKTGLKPSALSNYINGNRLPRQDALSKIADAYNVSPSWLMGYNVPMEKDEDIFIDIASRHADKLFSNASRNPRKIYGVLIAAAYGCTDEQIQIAINTLLAFKKSNKEDNK